MSSTMIPRAVGWGDSARSFLEEGSRYVIFVFDHYFVHPAAVFVVQEIDGQLMCECPDGSSIRSMTISEFRQIVDSELNLR